MKNSAVWKKSLDTLKELISPQHFSTWFSPVKLIEESASTFKLEVPNRFFLEWIKEHYQPLILEIVKKNTGLDFEIVWNVAKKGSNKEILTIQAPQQKNTKTLKPAQKSRKPSNVGLNSKYLFDNFVVGKANEFAHAASLAVSNNLASKYNPLFIYGDVGLGKTHLLQAIGQRVIQTNDSIKIHYYTSEKFMNEFISYVSRQKMNDFRKKFRNVDLLLIDDIQFWAGKERTQEEFFHTFNALHEEHKQIVVTSDRFPKEIDGLEERLRSRFEWGLIADIQPPDMETKIAILHTKAKAEGISLPDDVAELLASVNRSNIRELEGYLTRVIAVSSLTGLEITVPMAKEALKRLMKDKIEKVPGADELLKAVSLFYNVKISDLKGRRRNRAVALPRQVFMYLARVSGKLSFPEIGAACKKDHSTAIYAVQKIEKELQNKPELKRSIKTIKKDLGVG
ncbi:MAG: chromosomal replication initiator protein DnaA [Thermodesulfobacteriota bacterium]